MKACNAVVSGARLRGWNAPGSRWILCVAGVAAAAVAIASARAAQLDPARSTQTPRRIVSLIPAVTEMLFAIGAGAQVVAVSSFDDYPPEVRTLQRVGALLDPDLERILALKADLVAVYATQIDLRRQLERAGVPAFLYAHAGLADIAVTIRRLGERTGHAAQADEVVRRINMRLDEIRRRTAGRPRPRTLVVFGREGQAVRAVFASGGTGFLHDMLVAAGGENVFGDVGRQSLQVTSEMILARRPDVVLELRARPLSAEEQRMELDTWKRLSSLPAVRAGRVHFIADPRTVVPGPRVAEGTELVARALHPEVFE